MLAPRSYTSEDVIELQCHGGGVCVQRVLACCLAAGARLAKPGEFTLRAFLNGRLDLSQVLPASLLYPLVPLSVTCFLLVAPGAGSQWGTGIRPDHALCRPACVAALKGNCLRWRLLSCNCSHAWLQLQFRCSTQSSSSSSQPCMAIHGGCAFITS